MLKRQFRLRAKGKIHFETTVVSPFFLLRIKHNGRQYNRYGFTISKRVDKKAVVRNRIKRIMSTCIQEIKSLQTGFDVLFTVKAEARNVSHAMLCDSVKQAFQKGELLE